MNKATNWASKSDGNLWHLYQEAMGWQKSGADGYEEMIKKIETELKKREII